MIARPQLDPEATTVVGSPAANRGIALLRIAFLPIAVYTNATIPHPRLDPIVFPIVAGLFGLYAVVLLVLAFDPAERVRIPGWQTVGDLLFAGALVYATGGARSPLRYVLYVMPLGAALRLSFRVTLLWLGLALVTLITVSLLHPATARHGGISATVSAALAIAWIGTAAVMISALLGRRQRALTALAEARKRLVQEALDAEARERRRLAEALHDEAVQNVLLARQELADAERGVPGAAARAREALDETDRQLRHEILQMHPVALEHAGLGAVVQSFADDAARHGRFTVEVDTDPAAGGRQRDLLVAVVRELLGNVVKHAHAEHVTVVARVQDGRTLLRVADDGRGLPAERLDSAVQEGHIGLASLRERVRAVGGDVTIASRAGAGTSVTVTLPDEPRAALPGGSAPEAGSAPG